ncbi:hypothetical protein BKA70DRAFT_1241031 [Coprinopsis sp. MPI-PUGE-AT-0042]|nr:hypothetical protein BKA70DRAFT_1241031 [Coprinopsis sp. MPI-PUGE-AT-0042]
MIAHGRVQPHHSRVFSDPPFTRVSRQSKRRPMGGSSGACIAPIDKVCHRGLPMLVLMCVESRQLSHLTVVLQTMVPISGQILSGVEGVPPKHNLLGWLWLCPMSRGRYCQLSIWSFRRRLLSTRPAGSWIIAHNGFHQGRPPGHTATLALMSWVVNMADQHPQTPRRGMKERFKTFTERWRKPASRSSSPRPAAGSTSQLVVGQPVNASSGSRSGKDRAVQFTPGWDAFHV